MAYHGRFRGRQTALPAWIQPFLFTSLTLVTTLALAPDSSVGQTTPPHVAGYVRHYQPQPASAEAGRLLLGELNCVSCHRGVSDIAPKPAPDLSSVGSRIHADYFETFLLDPHAAKPGTTMPDVLASLPADERRAAASALAALLRSTGTLAVAPAVTGAVEQGRELFATVGCAICHQPRSGDVPVLETSTPLPDLEAKYSVPSLTQFLSDPLAVRAGGRMPHLGLTAEEARAIASYLLKDIEVPASLTYRYYEGDWSNLPNFDELTPKSEGQAVALDLSVAQRGNQFGLVFDSYLVVPRDGDYTFHLGSDDGSRLLLGELGKIVEVDGIHPVVFDSARVKLESGVYPIQVQFFEGSGGEELRVEWEGPDLPRQRLDASLVSSPEALGAGEDGPQPPTAAQIAAGKQWYERLQCAQCHTLNSNDRPLLEQPASIPLVKLQDGCLSGTGQVPQYDLSAHQQASLRFALQEAKQPTERDAQQRVESTLVQFNCIACHQRDELGGVEEARNALFVTTQPEMGDEGRLPPPLTGIGSKLNPEWFAQLLDRGANDRFYMLARMPGFGQDNVGHVIPDLQQLDPLEDPPQVTTTEPERRLKVAGHFLAGDQALGCIKCHVFADKQATGIQAISLTTMTRRLNKDWFQKYMLDPNVLRPGTRMPASFPKGKTYYKDLLDGTATSQIHALWVYLSDGDQAKAPDGLTVAGIELVADEFPRIYRNFISDAGPRAIAVGYPEKVNLAFDADQLRLALLWQGRFIDAALHWTGRGQGFQGPLGINVLKLDSGPDLAILDDPQAAWPNGQVDGQRFLGYRLDSQRRPAFRYRIGSTEIEDQPIPIQQGDFPALRREFRAENLDSPLVQRVLSATEIDQVDARTFATPDGLELVVQGDVEPFIVSAGGKKQLRLRIPERATPASWSVTYRW